MDLYVDLINPRSPFQYLQTKIAEEVPSETSSDSDELDYAESIPPIDREHHDHPFALNKRNGFKLSLMVSLMYFSLLLLHLLSNFGRLNRFLISTKLKSEN